MPVKLRPFLTVVVGICLAFAASAPASAQDLLRRLIVTENADYTGFDYNTLRGTTQDACEAACVGDNSCRAFTFNQSANWCFLKSDFGALTVADNAVAGRIVTGVAPTPDLATQRAAELDFLSSDYVDQARRFEGTLASLFPPGTRAYGDLIHAAGAALSGGDNAQAASLYGSALVLADEDPKIWIEFGRTTLNRTASTPSESNEIRSRTTLAAINAYLRSTDDDGRASALVLLGDTLQQGQLWTPAIRAFRASIALRSDAIVQTDLDQFVAEHGFRILNNQVDADADAPRICIVFSDALPVSQPGLSDFVTVDGGAGLAIEPEENQICVDGVQHGERYRIQVRAGLPSAAGETLQNTAVLDVFVPDRDAFVGFAGTAYVLPAGPQPTIPLQSVNTGTAEVEIYRIGDRSLAFALREGIFLSQLEPYRAQDIADTYGEQIWTGTVSIDNTLNEMVTTAIPVEEALGGQQPGVYVITARLPNSDQDYWDTESTQWFVISDLGLTALTATDGIHAFVRSLATAEAEPGVTVRLVARNNEDLGQATTDANGYVNFGPGLTRGEGGDAPQVLIAETADADYAFLDLTQPAFDLTDRGVTGRPAPAAIDAYLTTERGVYRPGETVYATALLRDSRADAVEGLPLTVVVDRPDGVELTRTVLTDQGLGGYLYELPLRPDAMRGSWQLSLYSDPDGAPIAQQSFLVEDFEPDRLAFDLTTDATAFDPIETTDINIEARYLYGATAPGLTVSGDIAVAPVDTLDAFPGYTFGRVDDTVERIVEPIDAAPVTDDQGHAVVPVTLPDLPDTTRLLEGQAVLRLTDTSGRAVERSLTLPIVATGPHIGIRSLFDGYVGQGDTAEFDIIAVGADGQRTEMDNVQWDLLRLDTSYQWYNANGSWRWQAVTTTARVSSGTLDLTTGDPIRISSPVDWGDYRLELTSSGRDATSTSVEFYAGWYTASAGTDTPDVLTVALDQPSYRIGDTAHLRLDPQFAGIALITVVDDRLISMQTVNVPAEGTTVDLPITDDWGPGAYVTATLYRPMDLAAGRLPARALGLTWATVNPGDRDLDVTLDLPDEVRPRGPLTIPVDIGNLPPGTEAYVAVTAVDLGILNLTNYQPPAPDLWYFGQRSLGTEIRDLYGQLIDTTQGELGALRSGGDAGPVRLGSPPPTQALVAYHSGIVRVDQDGHATVTFDLPDFNGTVRVMAEAWSQDGVGHAVKDVFVRDPVVVQLTTPRFLNIGDRSRMLVEINNVSGPAGDYQLTMNADDGVGLTAPASALTLAAGERRTLAVPLSGMSAGDFHIRVTLTMPDGEQLPKDLTLGVRAPGAVETQTNYVSIPGNGGTLTLDATGLSRFYPGTGELMVTAGAAARLNVAGVLAELDRYPYGCVEQTTSRAVPLLYLNDVAAAIGIASDTGIDQRIRDAIDSVLNKQASSGAFGLWGPYDDGDTWLDAYVTDFLVRAAAAGYEVPQLALTQALDNLSNSVAYAVDFSNGGEDIAYALYVLAEAGRASIGDLRYYAETKIDSFATPLAQAQIGAALALYGDQARAERVFQTAMAKIGKPFTNTLGYRVDYGSDLRDLAAVLALAAESHITSIDLAALTQRVAALRNQQTYTSTQEDAWVLMAASALIGQADPADLSIDGTPLAGPLYRRFADADLVSPVQITNNGADAVDAAVTALGVPVDPPAAGGNGFTIQRAYYLPDGTLADVSTVAQNDRFVVTLTVTASEGRTGQLLIVDRLPAGFEIENPDLSLSGDVSRYPWLNAESYIDHTEAETDQFVAAVHRYSSAPLQFTIAYTVRAVSPGTFIHPAATVEDMYRPDFRANTDTSTVEVVGPTQ